MYQIDGWIELLEADSEKSEEDWRRAAERHTKKVNCWQERVDSYQSPGVQMEIRSMNGDVVLILHAVRAVTKKKRSDIESFLSEIAMSFCESIGLVYFKNDCSDKADSYCVMIVKNGKISFQHDPFFQS